MNNNYHTAAPSSSMDMSVNAGLRSFMLGIYNHMMIAMVITGAVAFFSSQSTELMRMIYATPLRWVVMFAPLGFVFFLSARIFSMNPAAARGWFYAFAAVMGLSLSYIFLVYTVVSIAQIFFTTAIMFGGTSLYGYTTKKDLTGMGSFLIMGVIGLIVASLVNLFLHSSALQFAVSVLGVLIFAGLTAYDTQRLKAAYFQVAGSAEMAGRVSVMGALSLYINFLNMFLFLLQLFGGRR